jgi:hypothetical protein
LVASNENGVERSVRVVSIPSQTFHPDIPGAWDDKEVASFELSLAQRDRSSGFLAAVAGQTLLNKGIA